MAMKRKFDVASDEAAFPVHNAKQLKLVPFPNYEPDTDVAMSDVEPTLSFSPSQPYHIRIPSNASESSDSDTNSPVYPSFNLYPLPFFNDQGEVDPNSHSYSHMAKSSPPLSPSNVGLLQPTSNFAHHGSNCSQIPKLKVACAAGVDGRRTMWSFCEQCGSISMVDSN